jgi:hypothetical protein
MNIATLKIFGWVIVAFGLITIIGDGSYYKGFYVSPYAGYAEVVLGLIILFWIRVDSKNNNAKEEETICPKCQKVYMAGKAPANAACDSCGAKLEPLEGFYERHPELKETPEDYPQSEAD